MKWKVVFLLILISLGLAFLFFPLKFIDTGIGEGIVFFPVNFATSLMAIYWENGIRYDCSTISLLGYQSSFSQVVPAIVDGSSQDFSGRVADDLVVYASISDRITDVYQRYIDQAALVNTSIIEKCGADAFEIASF